MLRGWWVAVPTWTTGLLFVPSPAPPALAWALAQGWPVVEVWTQKGVR